MSVFYSAPNLFYPKITDQPSIHFMSPFQENILIFLFLHILLRFNWLQIFFYINYCTKRLLLVFLTTLDVEQIL